MSGKVSKIKSPVNDFVKKRVQEIETKEDFDDYIGRTRMSAASVEQRDAVISYVKKQYPEYDSADHTPTESILKMIKEGEADISDMEGF